MVAITVILAAVIAAFVFGMGPPEQAPQASLRGSADESEGDFSIVKLEHQGGDGITLANTSTRIIVDGTTANYVLSDTAFDAGESVYIISDGTDYEIGTSADETDAQYTLTPADLASSGDIVNVKIIDVASQQMIADLSVRF